MVLIAKPPMPVPAKRPSVFLAGSIEMGAAENWQGQFEKSLSDLDVLILNPRRDEWDASWEQTIENKLFREQVEWELAGLEGASIVAMYFAPAARGAGDTPGARVVRSFGPPDCVLPTRLLAAWQRRGGLPTPRHTAA